MYNYKIGYVIPDATYVVIRFSFPKNKVTNLICFGSNVIILLTHVCNCICKGRK